MKDAKDVFLHNIKNKRRKSIAKPVNQVDPIARITKKISKNKKRRNGKD